MHRFFPFFAFLFITTASPIFAQTAEEIIERYIENVGGSEIWKTVKTTKISGKISVQGMDISYETYSKAPNKEYAESNVMGKKIVEAFDGEQVWRINPFMGGTTPQYGTEEESKERSKKLFENKFIDYQEKGHSIELLGQEEIDGNTCFVIKMTEKDGTESTTYIDTESYLPYMISTVISDGGDFDGTESQTYLSEYTEIDGVYMAFRSETRMNGKTTMTIVIETAEVNVDIEDSLFEMPKE